MAGKMKAESVIVSVLSLADGRIKHTFSGGGIVIMPPFPTDPAWRERVSKDMSRINYAIRRRSLEAVRKSAE